ncbi:hypothetical protein BGLA2_930041 [Burkholderia gladioli]|nr:hypothetical protein BGLA2_930041 [Burkholderia gladioli]
MSCKIQLLPNRYCFNKTLLESGAGDESRTRDLNLGKVALYQLSYSRVLLPAAIATLLAGISALLLRSLLRSFQCSGEMRLCRSCFSVSSVFRTLFLDTCKSHIAPPRSRICGQASFM